MRVKSIMSQKKKRHHYVAKSYLRGFAENEMLWGWFRASNEIRDVHVNGVALEKGFYDLRRADGSLSDELEDSLAAMDGMTPNIIREATRNEPTAEALDGVRRLYATTLARNHQGRDDLSGPARRTREQIAKMYDEEFPDGAKNRDWAIAFVMREVYSVPDHLDAEPETISRLNVIRLANDILSLMPKSVCILRSSAQDFITSDAPSGYFDPAHPAEVGQYTGPEDWSSPTIELTIPLDRRHAALIANIDLPPIVRVNLDGVRVVNARTAFFAKRLVLAHPTDDAVQALFFEYQVINGRYAWDAPLLAAFQKPRPTC